MSDDTIQGLLALVRLGSFVVWLFVLWRARQAKTAWAACLFVVFCWGGNLLSLIAVIGTVIKHHSGIQGPKKTEPEGPKEEPSQKP
jgi:hypothetical protein